MKKLKFKFIALTLMAIFLSACNFGENALSVTFSDITGAGSTDATVSVVYQEEKAYQDKYTDIFIKSNQDNLTIKIKQELQDFVTITLAQKDVYYSLKKLISNAKIEKTKLNLYKDEKSVNYIINSSTDCVLTFKATIGDLSQDQQSLEYKVDVSKEFSINVKKGENSV